jgi:DNA-binding transcriptional regulator YiaG
MAKTDKRLEALHDSGAVDPRVEKIWDRIKVEVLAKDPDMAMMTYRSKEEKAVEVHQRVELALKRTGLSQRQFADVIGTTQPSVSRWLNGHPMSHVSAQILDAILAAKWNPGRRKLLSGALERGNFRLALKIAIGGQA